MLAAAPELPANMRVTGLRGVGKTVLLEEFQESARASGWEAAFLELQPSMNTDQAIREALCDLLRRTRASISRLQRIRGGAASKLSGVKLAVRWEELALSVSFGSRRERDLARELYETLAVAQRHRRAGVVLLLDEAQLVRDERDRHGEHPLSLLLAPAIALQRAALPLALVLCGLPTLTANLQRARSYAERLFRGEEITSLDPADALAAFAKPLVGSGRQTERRVAQLVVEEVEGYPCFIQLWGAELWDAAERAGRKRFSAKLLEAIRPEIYERLDSDFYKPRLWTLTPAEQDLLIASARCSYPPLRTVELAETSSKSRGNINVLLGRLVDAGALYRVRKGEYDYSAPRFRDFLLRLTRATDAAQEARGR